MRRANLSGTEVDRKQALLIIDESSVNAENELQYWRIADKLLHAGYDIEMYRAKDPGMARSCVWRSMSSMDMIICCGDRAAGQRDDGAAPKRSRAVLYHVPCKAVANLSHMPVLFFQILSWLHSFAVYGISSAEPSFSS